MKHRVLLLVMYKPTARDPEGETLTRELQRRGFSEIIEVRAGKGYVIDVEAEDRNTAMRIVEEIAERMRLFNPAVHSTLVIPLA